MASSCCEGSTRPASARHACYAGYQVANLLSQLQLHPCIVIDYRMGFGCPVCYAYITRDIATSYLILGLQGHRCDSIDYWGLPQDSIDCV